MRIAFAIRDRKHFIGGPSADAARLLMLFHEKGHEVYVLGIWVGEVEEHDHLDKMNDAGIPCIITRRQACTEDGVQWILQQLHDIQPDIFVAGLSTEGCFATHWIRKAGIPVVNVVYGNDPVNIGRSIYFTDCEQSWRVSGHVVYGQHLMSILKSSTRQLLPATVVSGIAELPATQAEYRDPQIFSIVYAGRLVELQKRTSDMIRSFIRLCKRYPYFRFHLIGDSVSDERARYEQMVRESGYDSRILFHGILRDNEYNDELSRHQAVILLSDYEGIPGSVIDGMAAGLVPVCLRYSGVEDLITHGETGLIVEDRDSSLEHALVTLANQKQLWNTLATKAREHFRTHFSQNIVFDQWEKFLNELIRNSPVHDEIKMPRRIRLPKTSSLLIEDKRRPAIWKKYLKKILSFTIL